MGVPQVQRVLFGFFTPIINFLHVALEWSLLVIMRLGLGLNVLLPVDCVGMGAHSSI